MIDTGNTAWIITATALVLFMTLPGLALFYGGLVRKKNVLSVLMQCISVACLASVLWLVIGYSLAFGDGNQWIGDTSKMFLVGKSKPHNEKLVKVTQECLYKAIEIIKPGKYFGDIGSVIQTHAEKNFYSVVEDYCGHGIGKVYHEDPQVLHFGKSGTGKEIKEGMCFTIEPMINQGSKYTKLLSDGWTVETKDGRNSAQWEHTIAVTASGCEVLTKRSEENF